MMEAFISSATVLLSYYPVAIPTLLILSLESASSAKLWQALQKVPPSQPNPEPVGNGVNDAETPQQTKGSPILKGTFIAVVTVLFTAAIVDPKFLKDITKLKILYFCTLVIPFTLIIVLMMMGLCGLNVPVVARGSDGKALFLIKKEKASLRQKIFFTVFGAGFAVDALWFGQPLGVFVVYAALIHGITRYFNMTKLKFRYLSYMSAIASLVLVAHAVTLLSEEKQSPNATTPIKPVSLLGEVELVGLVNWRSIILSGIWSTFQFTILSLCYRFDYANSLPLKFQPDVSKKTNIGFIIHYPSHFAYCDTFPRPYFNTALVSLLFSYVVIAVLSANTMYKTTYDEASMVSVYIAPQMMSSSVLVLAAVKGQFRKFWNYEEDWNAAPSVGAETEATEVKAASSLLEEEIWVENEKDLISFDEKPELQGEQAV